MYSEVENQSKPFVFRKHVSFHETDAMGVVHHSNYVRYFEEARVAWMRARGLIEWHAPMGPYTFAVVDIEVRYLRPAKFEDEIEVWVQATARGARLEFQYAIWNPRLGTWCTTGRTGLVALNSALMPVKLRTEIRAVFLQESWSEVWPPAPPVSASVR
jgi:acyl-CoA thioester hydrolase